MSPRLARYRSERKTGEGNAPLAPRQANDNCDTCMFGIRVCISRKITTRL